MIILDLALLLIEGNLVGSGEWGNVTKNVFKSSDVPEANLTGGLDITWLARCVKS
jgi:hypothetical protein